MPLIYFISRCLAVTLDFFHSCLLFHTFNRILFDLCYDFIIYVYIIYMRGQCELYAFVPECSLVRIININVSLV